MTLSLKRILFLNLLGISTKAAPLSQTTCDRNILSQAADAYGFPSPRKLLSAEFRIRAQIRCCSDDRLACFTTACFGNLVALHGEQ